MQGVMFHHFHGEGHEPSQGSLSADDLHEMLDWIGTVITPAQAIDGIDGTCLTFDDGLASQVDIALPVLEERGLQAFWFVCTDETNPHELYRWWRHEVGMAEFYQDFFARVPPPLLELAACPYLTHCPFYSDDDRAFRWLRDEGLDDEHYHDIMRAMIPAHHFDEVPDYWLGVAGMLRLTDAGQTVGLHSHTHPMRLSRLRPDEQRDEYLRNFEIIEAATGVVPVSMSHPCGSYGPDTLRILMDLGVVLGFQTQLKNGHRLAIPRHDHTTIMEQMRAGHCLHR